MDRVRAINTKDMKEAKGMQMLKVNGTTKSVKRAFRAGYAPPNLWQSGFHLKAKVL